MIALGRSALYQAVVYEHLDARLNIVARVPRIVYMEVWYIEGSGR